jgi:hypothetical protein
LFSRGFVQINTVVHTGYIQPAVKRLADVHAGKQWKQLQKQTQVLAVRSSLLALGLLAPLVPALCILQTWGPDAFEPYVRIFADHFLVLLLMLGFLCGPVFCKSYANGLFVLRREMSFVACTAVAFAGGVTFKYVGASIGNLPGLAFGTTLYWVLYAGLVVFSFHTALRKNAAVGEFEPHEAVGEAVSPPGMAD